VRDGFVGSAAGDVRDVRAQLVGQVGAAADGTGAFVASASRVVADVELGIGAFRHHDRTAHRVGRPTFAAPATLDVLASQPGSLRKQSERLPRLACATRNVSASCSLPLRLFERVAGAGLRRLGRDRDDGSPSYTERLRGPHPPLLEYLTEGADIARGVLEAARVRAVARARISRSSDHSARIGGLLHLLIWLRPSVGSTRA
jgi:hypothetical protein